MSVSTPTSVIEPNRTESDSDGDRNPGPQRPKAYIVSDVLLYREGLSFHLQDNKRLDFIGAGPPTEATLLELERSSPDAVIVDLGMRDGIAFAEQVRDRVSHAKTVAFAVSDLDRCMVACAKAGICGYVPKDGTAEDIVLTVLHAVRGELHCTPKFAAMLLTQLAALAPEARVDKAGVAKLTPRQQEILEQISRGLSNKEIARLLGISAATVKNHVHQLLEKLSVHRRTEALAILYGQHLTAESFELKG
jgi:two-component system nitrate/nitrite response regulator NarL